MVPALPDCRDIATALHQQSLPLFSFLGPAAAVSGARTVDTCGSRDESE